MTIGGLRMVPRAPHLEPREIRGTPRLKLRARFGSYTSRGEVGHPPAVFWVSTKTNFRADEKGGQPARLVPPEVL